LTNDELNAKNAIAAKFDLGPLGLSTVWTTISPTAGGFVFKKKVIGAKNLYLERGATRKTVIALFSGESRR
jgi:hypothetical protein